MSGLLQNLRVLVAVDEAGGITAATHRLGRTQPAISRALVRLEHELDAALLDRNGRSPRLSPPGLVLAHRARRALGRLEQVSPRLAHTVSDRQLLAATAIAQKGSALAAGHHLGISQSAVSQALASLEGLVGRKLFVRSNSTLRPAPGSQPVLRALGLAWAEVEHGLDELRFLAGKTNGRLNIGALPLARPMLVPRALDAVLTHFPDARLSVADGPYESLKAALEWGEIDAIVGSLRNEDAGKADDLATVQLFEDQPIIVRSPGQPALSSTDMETLVTHTWILPCVGVPLRGAFEAALQKRGHPLPQRIIETNSITVVQALLSTQDRLALVSEHQVRPDIERGALVSVGAELQIRARQVGLVMRRDMQETPLFTAFVTALRSSARFTAP